MNYSIQNHSLRKASLSKLSARENDLLKKTISDLGRFSLKNDLLKRFT